MITGWIRGNCLDCLQVLVLDSRWLLSISQVYSRISKLLIITFLEEKTANIAQNIEASHQQNKCYFPEVWISSVNFENFTNISFDWLHPIICSAPSKSCNIDLIPACLLQQCVDILGHAMILKIVNISLESAAIPSQLKKSHPQTTTEETQL